MLWAQLCLEATVLQMWRAHPSERTSQGIPAPERGRVGKDLPMRAWPPLMHSRPPEGHLMSLLSQVSIRAQPHLLPATLRESSPIAPARGPTPEQCGRGRTGLPSLSTHLRVSGWC